MTDAEPQERQADLFPEEFDRPRVFRSLGGAFIGCFNRRPSDDGDAIVQLSAYLPSEAVARAALAVGRWKRPEP